MQGLLVIAFQVAFREGEYRCLFPCQGEDLSLVKGYLVDWDAQKAIWDGIFSDRVLSVSLHAPVIHSSPLIQSRSIRRSRRF
jgi:hypothetical protein